MLFDDGIRCASHLHVGLSPAQLKEKLPAIIRILRHHEFDAIACQGLSGLLVAPIVAHEMNKTLLVVRKHLNCHSDNKVEGDFSAKRYVILDDMISSGTTVRRIIEEIGRVTPAKCIGVCQYLWLNATSPVELKPIEDALPFNFFIQAASGLPDPIPDSMEYATYKFSYGISQPDEFYTCQYAKEKKNESGT